MYLLGHKTFPNDFQSFGCFLAFMLNATWLTDTTNSLLPITATYYYFCSFKQTYNCAAVTLLWSARKKAVLQLNAKHLRDVDIYRNWNSSDIPSYQDYNHCLILVIASSVLFTTSCISNETSSLTKLCAVCVRTTVYSECLFVVVKVGVVEPPVDQEMWPQCLQRGSHIGLVRSMCLLVLICPVRALKIRAWSSRHMRFVGSLVQGLRTNL